MPLSIVVISYWIVRKSTSRAFYSVNTFLRPITQQVPWDVPVDLFFYREPEELEKAEEAQAPFQEPAAVAAPGWGAEPMVGAAPTPMEGFQPAAPVDPTAVPMDSYQAPPAADALGGGWDAAPGGQEVVVDQAPQEAQLVEQVMPVDAGVPAAAGGGWDAAPQAAAPAAQSGGWGDAPAQGNGGW